MMIGRIKAAIGLVINAFVTFVENICFLDDERTSIVQTQLDGIVPRRKVLILLATRQAHLSILGQSFGQK